MSLKQKKRDEISEEYKWDLSSIYTNLESFEKDFDIVTVQIKKLSNYKNKLLKNGKNLYKYLELESKLNRLVDKLYTFAKLRSDEDTTNTKNQELIGRVANLYDELNRNTSFFKPMFLNCTIKQYKNFYKEEPLLKKYKFILEKVMRYKNHKLNESEEQIISKFLKILRNPSDTFESLTDSDIRFGEIIDENNNKVELTDSNYSKYLQSKNREVRKQAFYELYKVYGSYKNTLTSTLSGEVANNNVLAKIYNFTSSLSASLYADNINLGVYYNLIETVNKTGLPYLYQYYKLRKDILKLDEQHIYDTYVNLIEDNQKKYSFEEAKELVIKALSILGEDYSKILKQAFTEKWIDIYNNLGKRGGAYSGGCHDTNPYILLNYEETLNDVSTLAHELGHSIHSYYSRKNNDYLYSDYSIFVAEVASTVNELLLADYILKHSSNKKEKLTILNKKLEQYKSTLFRQTMFAEFELLIHEKEQNGEILTNELLSNEYYKLVQKYFGKSVYIDDEIKYEWSRIPHFYYNFYTYKYATGLSAAVVITNRIIKGDKEALNNYKEFLKVGSTMYPLDELKIAGVDLTKKEIIENALNNFKQILEEFRQLIK